MNKRPRCLFCGIEMHPCGWRIRKTAVVSNFWRCGRCKQEREVLTDIGNDFEILDDDKSKLIECK